MARRWE